MRILKEIVTRITSKAVTKRDEDGLLPGQKTIPSFMNEMVLPEYNKYLAIRIGTSGHGLEFRGTCDPSGAYTRSTGMQEIKAVQKHMPFVEPCRSNVFSDRRVAIADRLTRLVVGQPALIIDPSCKTLIRGMEGEFNLEQKMVSSAQGLKYAMEPDKQNWTSHICDDLAYFGLETSDGANTGKKVPTINKPVVHDAAFGR